MNRWVGLGYVGQSPEISESNGTKIAKFSLGIKRRFTKEDETDWIRCVCFNKQADFVSNYVNKGTKLAVEGRIQTGSYTNKDGQKVYTTDIIVDSMEFADSKKSAENNNEQHVAATQEQMQDFMNIPDDDGLQAELPFV